MISHEKDECCRCGEIRYLTNLKNMTRETICYNCKKELEQIGWNWKED